MKPMLASDIRVSELEQLTYPVIMQRKLDGVRCLVTPDKGAVTRSGKLIPNRRIYAALSRRENNYLDGEIIAGSFHETSSLVRTHDKNGRWTFFVFDSYEFPTLPFEERYKKIWRSREWKDMSVVMVSNYQAGCPMHVKKFYHEEMERGGEGIILRHARGQYKFGRSTLRQQFLLRIKARLEGNAIIVGFVEENDIDGNAKDTLGALLVNSEEYGHFAIGTGFSRDLRRVVWGKQRRFIGRAVRYEFQQVGTKDKPRQPSFKGFVSDE